MAESKPINEAYRDFITGISGVAMDATVHSHKSSLQEFVDDFAGTAVAEITEVEVAEFLATKHPEYRVQTLRGRLSTLANFLAYAWEEHPNLVQHRIRDSLFNYPRFVPKLRAEIDHPRLSDRRRRRVQAYLERLRNRHHGSRIHAFIELAVETGSHLDALRLVEQDDVDQAKVTIGLSDMYLVVYSGLLTERQVELSQSCCDAVKTYLKHQRSSPVQDQQALFTTAHGRVSRHTIYYDLGNTTSPVPSNSADDSNLSFKTIRKYALDRALED